MAAISGDVEVVRSLVTEHKADVHSRLRDVNTVTGFEAGGTPLHACTAFATTANGDISKPLLDAGADINAQTHTGM